MLFLFEPRVCSLELASELAGSSVWYSLAFQMQLLLPLSIPSPDRASARVVEPLSVLWFYFGAEA